ncbi:MAG: VanZ family protein [Clostridia bacterium]|nr:VanZ family protein [Clostridia bacterium]
MTPKQKKTAQVVFGIYLFLLIWLVLFKFAPPNVWPSLVSTRRIELIPFAARETGMREMRRETLANVAIFVPLGAYLSAFFPKKNFFFPVLIGFLLSLFFEIVQFAFGIGAADVTDLLMNTAGALIGILVWRLLERVLRRRAVTVMNAVGIAAETLFISLLTISRLFG